MNHDNLKEKTIFDFTNDKELLDLFGLTSYPKSEVIEWLRNDEPVINRYILWSFAYYTNNENLIKATEEQFDLEEFNGLTVD